MYKFLVQHLIICIPEFDACSFTATINVEQRNLLDAAEGATYIHQPFTVW